MRGRVITGFTAIEAVVGMFILTLIGIALYTFLHDTFSLNAILADSFTVQGEARGALKRMSAEVRSLSPSSTGAYPIADATASSFAFYSDIQGDFRKERVRYFLEGTTLKRGAIEPSGDPLAYNPANEAVSDIAHDVANGTAPLFEYFDAAYDGVSPPLAAPVDVPSVRLLKITIVVDHDPSRPPASFAFTTQVSMRNLKDNL